MIGSSRAASPRLVIAGGGPAAWIAAVYLRRILRRADWPVTVIGPPPPAAPTGALATRPGFTRFLRGFDIDETIFMRRCSAGYRLASRFEHWFEAGQRHWHPFGACGPRVNGRDLFHYWLRSRAEGGSAEAYAEYAPQTLAAAAGCGPRPEAGTSSIVESSGYGYHLDRSSLIRFLRDIALSEGVRAVPGRVRDAARDQAGNLRVLRLDSGAAVEGDLFIDATGTTGQLIEQVLAEPWFPGAPVPDRFASLSAELDPAMPAYTTYTGLPEGWIASLPLAGRTEWFLAYDSASATPDAAEAGLRAATGSSDGIVHGQIRSGQRRQPWQHNVVALGAAAGAVDPLHGFGLDLVLAALGAFVDYLPRSVDSEALARAYCTRMNRLHDEASEALAAHYGLGRRTEPFWAAARATPLPQRLAERLDLYELSGHIEGRDEGLFGESEHYLLLAGAGFLPRRPFAPVDMADVRELPRFLGDIRARSAQVAGTMARHDRLLEAIHGRRVQPTGSQNVRVASAEVPATGPANLRRTPDGARLADLVAGLNQPFGYERSVKASPAGLQIDRFLVSLHRTSLGLEPGRVLDRLAAKLAMPEPERREAATLIDGADLLHLGHEDGPSGALYKLYVEWSARTDAAWRAGEGGEPLLVHRAYKWNPHGSAPPVVTLYHWPRVREPDQIAARMTSMAAGWGDVGAGVLAAGYAMLRLAQEQGTGAIHFLEACEERGPRLSYDLNLYACGLTVATAEPILGPALKGMGIPATAVTATLAERRTESLGHLAGGVGRDGQPFLTVYSGMAGA
ncbi:tryptophan 7-halogenase [Methylobacterium brachythecii]|uniref:Tryptophan halogenase n=1 Tax=Methylobacterium brachythecii TaxID=1176177 RepID=A0A7W6F8T2_9HYPH|nr:tryptophan 7-halogenase [Methylobacterium brachythecii]MBB3904446.1 tryptophan halogenase [Methylobacterium brachythecii]GLS43623.1 hypothetical protein GCM10007884_16080 [Methylobacterium brachythecii]